MNIISIFIGIAIMAFAVVLGVSAWKREAILRFVLNKAGWYRLDQAREEMRLEAWGNGVDDLIDIIEPYGFDLRVPDGEVTDRWAAHLFLGNVVIAAVLPGKITTLLSAKDRYELSEIVSAGEAALAKSDSKKDSSNDVKVGGKRNPFTGKKSPKDARVGQWWKSKDGLRQLTKKSDGKLYWVDPDAPVTKSRQDYDPESYFGN